MPTYAARRSPAIDSDSKLHHPGPDLHDVSGVAAGTDADPIGTPLRASDMAAVIRNGATVAVGAAAANQATNPLADEHSRSSRSEDSRPFFDGGKTSSDGTLPYLSTITTAEAASASASAVRPIETAIWDWDAPLEPAPPTSHRGDVSTSSYYYEPQGELLHEHHHRPSRTEFSIPQAVPGSGVNWPFPTATTTNSSSSTAIAGANGLNRFAVSRRPSGIPPAVAGNKRKSYSEQPTPGRPPESKRASRVMSESSEDRESTSPVAAQNPATQPPRDQGRADAPEAGPSRAEAEAQQQQRRRRGTYDPGPQAPMILPPRKVFPIQIGDKLFRLSGAAISSDAPSYFSQFFEEQLRANDGADAVRTLYIDRDPATFEDISLHLQGYHIEPRDGPHFVKLFADAQYFSLPRLTAQLFASPIYIRIGDEEFSIPRDLFSNPGDTPNYFSLGFAIFFTTPNDTFPGLSQRSLLRPPSILPPSIPNRSAKTFADLLHILKGYAVEIRSEQHRRDLLRDARYFHLKGLEQRLIPHSITYNLARKKSEILIRLEDIRQSGVSFVADNPTAPPPPSPDDGSASATAPHGPGWVYYQRPYVDSEAFSLIVEVGGATDGSGDGESTYLALAPASVSAAARVGRASFFRQTLARITALFALVATKMNLPVTQPLGLLLMERGAGVSALPVSPRNSGVSEERVKVRIGRDADVKLDGRPWFIEEPEEDEDDDDDDEEEEGGEEGRMDVEQPSTSAAAGPSEGPSPRKRRRGGGGTGRRSGAAPGAASTSATTPAADDGDDWIVKKSQWRIRVQPIAGGPQAGKSGMEVILGAVKIEAYSDERGRNVDRSFLL